MTNDNMTLRQQLEAIIRAPIRSEVSTADITVGMWSSTMLDEKLFDLEALCQEIAREALERFRVYCFDMEHGMEWDTPQSNRQGWLDTKLREFAESELTQKPPQPPEGGLEEISDGEQR